MLFIVITSERGCTQCTWCLKSVFSRLLIRLTYLFICLLATWIGSLVKWMSKSFVHFLLFFLLIFKCSFYFKSAVSKVQTSASVFEQHYRDIDSPVQVFVLYVAFTLHCKAEGSWGEPTKSQILTIQPLTKQVHQSLFYTQLCSQVFWISSPRGLLVHFLNGVFLRNWRS